MTLVWMWIHYLGMDGVSETPDEDEWGGHDDLGSLVNPLIKCQSLSDGHGHHTCTHFTHSKGTATTPAHISHTVRTQPPHLHTVHTQWGHNHHICTHFTHMYMATTPAHISHTVWTQPPHLHTFHTQSPCTGSSSSLAYICTHTEKHRDTYVPQSLRPRGRLLLVG